MLSYNKSVNVSISNTNIYNCIGVYMDVLHDHLIRYIIIYFCNWKFLNYVLIWD